MRPIAASLLASFTEEEAAAWLRRQGARTVVHRGRHWQESIRGFYRPVNWLARLESAEATSPSALSWGFHAALGPADEASADGSIPAHVFADLAGFTPGALTSMQERNLKKCRKQVEMLELTGPELLRDEGHGLVVDSLARTGHSRPPTKDEYLAELDRQFEPGRLLVIAGRVDGKLAGYLTAYAVDGIAYVHHVLTLSEAMRTGINTGLLVELLLCCQRSPGIRELVHGLDTPENPSLVEFKRAFGFPVLQVPARVRVNPLLGPIVRARYPEKYYRLTGRR